MIRVLLLLVVLAGCRDPARECLSPDIRQVGVRVGPNRTCIDRRGNWRTSATFVVQLVSGRRVCMKVCRHRDEHVVLARQRALAAFVNGDWEWIPDEVPEGMQGGADAGRQQQRSPLWEGEPEQEPEPDACVVAFE